MYLLSEPILLQQAATNPSSPAVHPSHLAYKMLRIKLDMAKDLASTYLSPLVTLLPFTKTTRHSPIVLLNPLGLISHDQSATPSHEHSTQRSGVTRPYSRNLLPGKTSPV